MSSFAFFKIYVTPSGFYFWTGQTVLLVVGVLIPPKGLLHCNRVQCKIMKYENLITTFLITIVCDTET